MNSRIILVAVLFMMITQAVVIAPDPARSHSNDEHLASKGESGFSYAAAGAFSISNTYITSATETLEQQIQSIIESYDPNSGELTLRVVNTIQGFSGNQGDWWFRPDRDMIAPPSYSYTGDAQCNWSVSRARIECTGGITSIEFSYRRSYVPTIQDGQITHHIGFIWRSGAVANIRSQLSFPDYLTYIASTTEPSEVGTSYLRWNTPNTTSFDSDVTFQVPTQGEGVRIELRAFIPCEAIAAFGFAFAGDGYSTLTYRALQRVTVNPPIDDTSSSDLIVTGPERSWGASKRYEISQVAPVPNRPDWCRRIQESERDKPSFEDTLEVTESNNYVRVYRNPFIREIYVDLGLSGGNPAAPLPDILVPYLNADIRVDIRRLNGEYQYKLRGGHDGFPAYYLYLNGTRVYCYDPLEQGGSPWYLGGGRDIQVNEFQRWMSLDNVQDCTRPRGIMTNYPESSPGGYLTLTGNGFDPDITLELYANNTYLGDITVDGTGRFQTILATAAASNGLYTVYVQEKASLTGMNTTTVAPLESTSFILNDEFQAYPKDNVIATEISIPSDIAEPWKVYTPLIIQ